MPADLMTRKPSQSSDLFSLLIIIEKHVSMKSQLSTQNSPCTNVHIAFIILFSNGNTMSAFE